MTVPMPGRASVNLSCPKHGHTWECIFELIPVLTPYIRLEGGVEFALKPLLWQRLYCATCLEEAKEKPCGA
jgi:hypothetical protein